MLRTFTSRFLTLTILFAYASGASAQDLGLKVPPGFKVTLYADHELANDIYSMTLDDEGSIVVSGRGYVKRLIQPKLYGNAERAELMLETKTGAMGLWSNGLALHLCADGKFAAYRVSKFGPHSMQVFASLRFSEHGGHGIRKGPDGCFYVIGGNDAELAKVKLDSSSPIKSPEAGGILRFSKDMKKVECIAHGFRNPYRFDFTPLGDIITYDSDTERDFLLPWYSPTRIYHVAYGQHHGWRLPGYLQSLARRDYYPDTVDILAPIGRGSPTGVVCYRHYQFPKRYWGGVFALDWTFGKIWFLPLEADGSSYKTKPELFLEPIGDNGFAPTDACVAPDGSLFVCIGGRGTRGAVYRIEYVGTKDVPAGRTPNPHERIDLVLDAPQPLDAWSRSEWVSQARSLGAEPFYKVVANDKETKERRIRAIEVLTDELNGLPLNTAETAAAAKDVYVRARIAWSLGRDPNNGGEKILLALAQDSHPRVRAEALNSIGDQMQRERRLFDAYERKMVFKWSEREALNRIIAENLGHSDKRVRMAACSLIPKLDTAPWVRLMESQVKASLRTRLTFAIADYWRLDYTLLLPSQKKAAALEALKSASSEMRLDALRLLMLMDGDWCLHNPPQVVYSAYALQKPHKEVFNTDKEIRAQLRKIYPTGDANFDHEAARYFAMIQDDDPATVGKVLGRITKESAARDDVHHLIVLARLKGEREPGQTAAIADALFGLEKKWKGYQQQVKQTWAARLSEVVVDLVKKHPDLPEAMLKHPAFVHPSHVVFTGTFNAEQRKRAARLFAEAVKKDGDFQWSPDLIELLAMLPAAEHRPLFRKHWSDFSLRDAIVMHLVKQPDAEDRSRFLDSLDSPRREVVLACIAALEKLPKSPTAANLAPVLRRLRTSLQDPKENEVRQKLLAFINREVGPMFSIGEDKDPVRLKELFDPVFTWFEKKYPAEFKLLTGDEDDAEHWKKQLAVAPWDKGDAARGMKLFQQRSCAGCHTGSSRIGPDLTGSAGRFSRDDLFTAIINPSRDVAPAYRVDNIETQDGKRFAGIVVFESADGVIVQLDAVNTVRIDSGNIASRQPGKRSLMPNGLLKDLKPGDLADLYAYLKSLKP